MQPQANRPQERSFCVHVSVEPSPMIPGFMTHAPSRAMNSGSLWINGPLYPSLSSSIRYEHRIKIKIIAAVKNTANTLKLVGNGVFPCWNRCARVYLTVNSILRAMKTQSVKTWKERPAMATSTAVLLLPEETDDKAPPTACKIRESRSQGYGRSPGSVLYIEAPYRYIYIEL